IATNMPQQSGTIISIPRGTQGQIGTIRIGLSWTKAANYVDNNGVKQFGMTASIQLFSKDRPRDQLSVYLGQSFDFDGYTFFVREIRPTHTKPEDPPGTTGGGLIRLLCIPKDLKKKTAQGTTKNIPAAYGVAMPLKAKKMSFGLTVGERVFIQLPAAGGMPPYSWSLWSTGNVPVGYKAGLPDGLSLDPDGYLTGILQAEPATYYFALMLQDSGGSSVVSEEYIVVYDLSNPKPDTNLGEGGPSMGGDPTPHGFEFSAATAYGRFGQGGYLQRGGADFTSDQFVYIVPFVHGGTRPWTFIINGLPEGLTYNPSTGIIQGMLDKAKKRTMFEVKSYLRDATGQVAYPETGRLFKFRVDYVESIPVVNSPTADKGTLSVSGGAGNTLSLNGIGVIGTGSAVVTIPAGSYTLTVTSPTGAQLYRGTVRIDAGKVTTARISPW
ncbi:MAG: putative Ig domain-containing protein, partial [Eubacteriales bacterium]